MKKYKLKIEKKDIDKKIELETIIIKKIKDEIISKKNELEIINSELYILEQKNEEINKKNEIQKQKKEINKLLKRIAKIKEQIDIYSKDKTLEDAIYLDNRSVIDDILEYKKICETRESLKEEYECIEEYGTIVKKIDELNEKCIKLEEQKNIQMGLQEIQEDEIEELEKDLIKEDKNINSINNLISEQTELINEIDEKISIIETEKEIVYNYDLLNRLISLELKYMAIMSLSPLKGTIPYITIAALKIRDTMKLLLSRPLVKAEEKITYISKDYINEIENSEYRINDIENIMNDSVNTISNFKEKILNNEVLKTNPKYEELILKLEKMTDFLNENISKVEILKAKNNRAKTKNKDTLIKVLRLNEKK